MSRGKVSPDSEEDSDCRILQDTCTSLESQIERQKVIARKYEASPLDNMVDVFKSGMRISASRPCLGTRADASAPFTWLTYQEVFTQAMNIGSFLTEVLKQQRDSFVGIYSKNRAEWEIFELGCFMNSLVPVPLYDTLGPEATDHILRQTQMAVMLCESPQHLTNLKRLRSTGQLQHIIQITGRIPKLGEVKQQVWSWQEALKSGRDNPAEQGLAPTKSNLAILCYTSGTTGLPKGVEITHGNLIAESLAISEFIVAYGGAYIRPPNCDDVYLSYLPLAHIFERILHVICFLHGMRIGFYRGDVLTLVDDMKELKPTLFCTVPRLLNRIYEKTMASVSSSCLKAALFRMAMSKKADEVSRGIIRKNSIWDSLVFRKIQASTGNCIRLVIVGSAPLAEEVMRFSRVAFGCPVLEGYGQTETMAGTVVTLPGNPTVGNVGIPVPANIVQLQDVPDMNYFSCDGTGEICIKGLSVTSGYYRLEEETARTIDKSGWLHTGDIGQWTPEGFLKIIDRKKHIFKLSQGEYIAPEKIEQIYNTNKFVHQIFVHGDSLESCVLAVVVPNPEAVLPWARAHNVQENISLLCANEQLKAEILASMQATGRENSLKSFEQVKAIHLHPEPFSVENGLLTPTFKSMRTELKRTFEEIFRKMYFNLKQMQVG